MTISPDQLPSAKTAGKAWHFPTVLVHDRSAAWRGEECGQNTHRTASEAVLYMTNTSRITMSWWDPIRDRVLAFAGAEKTVDKILITYVSRQGARRHLLDDVGLSVLVYSSGA